MKRYVIKYQLGSETLYYVLDAESEEDARETFLTRAKQFYGGNLLLTEYGYSTFPIIHSVKKF